MFTLILGGFSVPGTAQAGFFEGLIAGEASAEVETPLSDADNKNSQSKSLSLEANVSGASILEDKKESKSKAKDEVKEEADVSIVSDNALLPTTGLLGVTDGTDYEEFYPDTDPDIYVVRKFDTVQKIADIFGISKDTIYSVNNLPKGSSVKEGQVLVILPFSGIEYTVAKKDTIASIAKKFKVKKEDIFYYNDIDEDTNLVVGDQLIIPDANLPDIIVPKKSSRSSKTSKRVIAGQIINRNDNNGIFINPIDGGHKGRGTSTSPQIHKGVDIGAPMGTPIHAAASGTVIVADSSGYNGGFGLYVVIQHADGQRTAYAHMSKVKTTVGKYVEQGEIIGLVGSTGHSTGPHVHFEVRDQNGGFFANPGNTWSWKPWNY